MKDVENRTFEKKKLEGRYGSGLCTIRKTSCKTIKNDSFFCVFFLVSSPLTVIFELIFRLIIISARWDFAL